MGAWVVFGVGWGLEMGMEMGVGMMKDVWEEVMDGMGWVGIVFGSGGAMDVTEKG